MKLKVKDNNPNPVFVLKLSEKELKALYNSINSVDSDRFVNEEQQELAGEIDDLIANAL